MASIGFYEVSTHEHNLYYFVRIAVAAGHDVTVFTHEDTADVVSELLGQTADQVSWVRTTDEESVGSFLSRIEPVCDERLDLFIAQSLYPQSGEMPAHLRFRPDCKRLLWIYNVNRWLATEFTLERRLVWNAHMACRKLLLRKYDAFCVQYPPMAEYIESELSVSKPVYALPSTIYEGDATHPTDPVRFTVPGQIESKRRDYEIAMSVFEDLFDRYGSEIALHLLGRPNAQYGQNIVDRCEALSEEGHDITYHREWIPRAEFDEGLRTSSVLLSPIRPLTRGREVTEKYGTTKGSGNVFDALRHATPIILPEYFQIAEMTEGSAVTYGDSDDLRRQIEGILNDRERLDSLTSAAVDNAERFRLRPQCERFNAVVDELL